MYTGTQPYIGNIGSQGTMYGGAGMYGGGYGYGTYPQSPGGYGNTVYSTNPLRLGVADGMNRRCL